MDTRDSFWYSYTEMLHRSFYLEEFKWKISDRNKYISWIVAFVSSGSVAVWSVWNKYPLIWTLLTIAMQMVGIAYPSFQYSQKEYALNLAIPEVQRIVIEMERDWIFIDETPDKTIAKKRLDYSDRYNCLDGKYLLGLNLKPYDAINESATNKRNQYLAIHYPNNREEEVAV